MSLITEKGSTNVMLKKILISFTIILAVTTVAIGGALWYYVNQIPRETIETPEITDEDQDVLDENGIPSSTNSLGTAEDVADALKKYDGSIKNILLLGIDSEDGVGRSDSMVILTVDNTTDQIKLTSLIRDSYVYIAGRGMDKLNHAYSFGGPSLALRAVNTNFDLNITDYVTVNFDSITKIVDAVGGLDLKLTAAEAKIVGVDGEGTHHLDGAHTLRYARIRSTAGGDFTRTLRHRKVLTAIAEKLMELNPVGMARAADELLPLVKTSLSTSEILGLGYSAGLGRYEVVQDSYPEDETSKGVLIKGIYYLKWDKDYTVDKLHAFIFNE